MSPPASHLEANHKRVCSELQGLHAGSGGRADVLMHIHCPERVFSVCARVCVCVEVSVVSFLPHCVWWGSCRRAEGDGDDLSSGRRCWQTLMPEPWQSGTMLDVQFLNSFSVNHPCWKVSPQPFVEDSRITHSSLKAQPIYLSCSFSILNYEMIDLQ